MFSIHLLCNTDLQAVSVARNDLAECSINLIFYLAVGTDLEASCGLNPSTTGPCFAAFMALHLTTHSSAYLEVRLLPLL